MGRIFSPVLTILFLSLFLQMPATASETETRLRDALRQAITQNRALEDSQAKLQARLAEVEKQNEALQAQPRGPDKEAVERMEAECNQRLTEQNEALARAGETLDKWKAAYEEAAGVARAKEAERAQLAARLEGLSQQATACEAKNAELFRVGNEILDRYAAVGVADVLSAKEPFLGFKRVELQNLVQDYQDKILDQKVQNPATSFQSSSSQGGTP